LNEAGGGGGGTAACHWGSRWAARAWDVGHGVRRAGIRGFRLREAFSAAKLRLCTLSSFRIMNGVRGTALPPAVLQSAWRPETPDRDGRRLFQPEERTQPSFCRRNWRLARESQSSMRGQGIRAPLQPYALSRIAACPAICHNVSSN